MAQRLARYPQPNAPQIKVGDANVEIDSIISDIPQGSLSLAFLDPYGLHLNFNTVAKLATRRADLIIFFPDHLDALRNWEAIYKDRPNSNLDRFLGASDWRAVFETAPRNTWAEQLKDLYITGLKRLDYVHFDYQRISRGDGVFLYRLIFASKHIAGAKIWKNIALRDASGQNSLDFPL